MVASGRAGGRIGHNRNGEHRIPLYACKRVAGSLVVELSETSRRFASSAVRARAEGDEVIFLLHGATALEQLMKSYLASLDPALIAAPDFDSMLHARGMPDHANTRPDQMRTIPAREAFKRVAQVVPRLAGLSDQVGALFDARNGLVHLGHQPSDRLRELELAYLRTSQLLLAALGIAPEEYWREFTDAVNATLAERVEAARSAAASALAAARMNFDDRFGGLDDPTKRSVVSAIESSYELEQYYDQLVDCPACGSRAMASGGYKVDWEVDYDREGDPVNAFPVVTFLPERLQCRVCGLVLSDEAELAAAEVAISWQLPDTDIDPADFYEEPDWDDSR